MKKITQYNSLQVINPRIASEWHPTKNGAVMPAQVTSNSTKQIWWLCRKGHEWMARPHSRGKGQGCPFCANKRVDENNCLKKVNPTLAKEWDIEKNGLLTPHDVVAKSHKKVWWLCRHGHQWLASIAHRSNGRNCPFCSNKKVCFENCLASKNPDLAKEWHKEKNHNVTPYDVVSGSGKKVWWICPKGHEWESIIGDRTTGKGCPYCSGRKVNEDNSLSVLNPKLAAEWHVEKNDLVDPTKVTVGSNKIVWWLCQKGHDWKASIVNRARGRGCPFCKNRKLNAENNLEAVNPTLASEWHSSRNGTLTPRDVFPNSNRKVWWQCKRNKNHVWLSNVNNRSQLQGCPFCSSATSSAELRLYAELKMLFPDIKHRTKIAKMECDLYIPSVKIGIEVDGTYWHKNKYENDIEKNIHFERVGVRLIRIRDIGLEKISDRDVIYPVGRNDVGMVGEILRAVLRLGLAENNIKKSLELYLEDGEFRNNEEYIEMLDRLPGPPIAESLDYKNEQLAKQWHPVKNGTLTPKDVSPGSGRRVWWLCNKRHEWEAVIGNRTIGSNCPYCANQLVGGENCLAVKNPLLAKEWNYEKNIDLRPSDVTPGSGKKVWWLCVRGHEWEAQVGSRNSGVGCPYCSNQRTNDENSLAILNPVLAKEWNHQRNINITPQQLVPGSNKKVWWACSSGHEWQEKVNARHRGLGCPFCSGRRACKDNSIASLKPDLAHEWHTSKNKELRPDMVTCGSCKSIWWLCKEGHEWKTRVSHRSNGSGCPQCNRGHKAKLMKE